MNDRIKIHVTSEETPERIQYWAEVLIDPGPCVLVIYCSGFYDNETAARLDAKSWLKKNPEMLKPFK